MGLIGPGLLVAATGVGAGDIATTAFAGSRIGYGVLWAAAVGAGMKYILNEGLARWQIATRQTLLEGVLLRLGLTARVLFLMYFLPWSFFVGGALISACGITAHAIAPVFSDPNHAKVWFGLLHSIVGALLVHFGGFRVFEKVMVALVGVMSFTILVTALQMRPDWGEVLRGLMVPSLPTNLGRDGVQWTIAVMGGIGGTLTILCYGYWIREKNREGADALTICRVDLAIGYAMTGLFAIAMVIVTNGMEISGEGALLIVQLAAILERSLGSVARWLFLIGAWATVVTSLLGVWQAVPYVFADYWNIVLKPHDSPTEVISVDPKSWQYRAYLWALATVPMLGIFREFRDVQKYYAVVGAAFIPLLALALLILNASKTLVGSQYRNGPITTAALVITLVFFVVAGCYGVT